MFPPQGYFKIIFDNFKIFGGINSHINLRRTSYSVSLVFI